MFLVGGTITDPESPPPTSGADKGIYKGSQYNGPSGAPHPVPTQYNGTDPVLYNFNAQPGQTIIPPGQAMPGPSNVPGVAWVSTPVQWGSYLADLWHSSGDGSLYRVYDDWNWQFGGTTSPPGANGWVGDLNTFYYYQPYQAPSGQITLGTPGDPSYYAANYNVSGTPGDLRPLFAQHVAPAKPLLLTHRDPPEPYLAKLTWILPPFNYSDHPVYTSAEGSYYVAQIVDALRKSEFWESTVLIITYDESDTHFDHLPPPLSPDPRQVPDGVPFEPWVQDVSGMGDETAFGVNSILDTPAPIGAGMRVPTIIVSPWTYGRGIISDQLDHTSILQLMETVFRGDLFRTTEWSPLWLATGKFRQLVRYNPAGELPAVSGAADHRRTRRGAHGEPVADKREQPAHDEVQPRSHTAALRAGGPAPPAGVHAQAQPRLLRSGVRARAGSRPVGHIPRRGHGLC